MFTGLVEEVGRVLERAGSRLVLGADLVLEESGVGASVAVNGACLTVVEVGASTLRFDVGPETLVRTALGDLAVGDPVNLERPMRLVGTVAALTREAETARLTIEWPGEALAPLLIPQGSVAVDGVSLTVARLNERDFEIMIIPHTLAATTLGGLTRGKRVNLEMDMIGKYVQRILQLREPPAPVKGPDAREGTR